MSDKATPRPWRVSRSGYSVKSADDSMPIVAQNPWGTAMREVDVPRWLANADLIVRAVNAHDALVMLANRVLNAEVDDDLVEAVRELALDARAALKLAGAEHG